MGSGMSGATPWPGWLVEATDSTPVELVAATTIRRRLDVVWSELDAVGRAPGDADAVHRLRVATRRTRAALDAFEDLLPRRRAAWFKRQLAEIRRTAGDARDLDILAERLTVKPGAVAPPESSAAAARSRLVAMLARQRDLSREPIRDLRERLAAAGWEARSHDMVSRIRRGGKPASLADYARRRFKPLADRFFEKAGHRLRDDDDVHRLRIAGKKFRYALEIFSPALPKPALSRCQKELARLQETLGEFTDHASAADRFRRLSRAGGPGLDRTTLDELSRRESRLATTARKAFVKWWDGRRRRQLRRSIRRSLCRRPA